MVNKNVVSTGEEKRKIYPLTAASDPFFLAFYCGKLVKERERGRKKITFLTSIGWEIYFSNDILSGDASGNLGICSCREMTGLLLGAAVVRNHSLAPSPQ